MTSGGPTGTAALRKRSGQCCGKSVFQHLQSKLKKGLETNTLQQATLISPSTHLLPSCHGGREIAMFVTHLALWPFDSHKRCKALGEDTIKTCLDFCLKGLNTEPITDIYIYTCTYKHTQHYKE